MKIEHWFALVILYRSILYSLYIKWHIFVQYVSTSPSCMELPSVGQQKVTDQGVGDWIAWLKDNMGINFNVDNLNWSKLCDEYMLVFFFCTISDRCNFDHYRYLKIKPWRKITSPVSEPREPWKGNLDAPCFKAFRSPFLTTVLPVSWRRGLFITWQADVQEEASSWPGQMVKGPCGWDPPHRVWG